MKGYHEIAQEDNFQEFDCEQDTIEDITGNPDYIAIDGILYYKNQTLTTK